MGLLRLGSKPVSYEILNLQRKILDTNKVQLQNLTSDTLFSLGDYRTTGITVSKAAETETDTAETILTLTITNKRLIKNISFGINVTAGTFTYGYLDVRFRRASSTGSINSRFSVFLGSNDSKIIENLNLVVERNDIIEVVLQRTTIGCTFSVVSFLNSVILD